MEDFNPDQLIKDQFSPVKDIELDIKSKSPLPGTSSSFKPFIPNTAKADFIGGYGMQEIKQKHPLKITS